jgi:hypothetical protein
MVGENIIFFCYEIQSFSAKDEYIQLFETYTSHEKYLIETAWDISISNRSEHPLISTADRMRYVKLKKLFDSSYFSGQ